MITDEPGRIYTALPATEGQGRYMGTHPGFRVKPENGPDVEWYSTEKSRLKGIACDRSLEDLRGFIAGGGKTSDYIEFYTNDDLYSVAYYYPDRP